MRQVHHLKSARFEHSDQVCCVEGIWCNIEGRDLTGKGHSAGVHQLGQLHMACHRDMHEIYMAASEPRHTAATPRHASRQPRRHSQWDNLLCSRQQRAASGIRSA